MMPKEVSRGLKKMTTLEKKESELMEKYNAIVSTCGYGQIPYVGHNTLDKAIAINKKRYKIWKDIRGFIFGSRTLWQIGIDSKFPVDREDTSEILHFGTKDINELIKIGGKNNASSL